MKICIISARFYPQIVGSGTITYLMAKLLSLKGHEVTVLTDKTVQDAVIRTNASYSFKVQYIDGLEDFAQGRASMQLPTKQIYDSIQKAGYDIVQVCDFMPMLLIGIIRKNIECPVAFTYFNTPNLPKRIIGYYENGGLDVALARFIIQSTHYDKLITGSKHYYTSALELGAAKNKTKLSLLGVDLKEFEIDPEQTQHIARDYLNDQVTELDTLLMLPSRITQQKGILDAINALKIVSDKHPVKLLLTDLVDPFNKAYAKEVMELAARHKISHLIIKPNRPIPRNMMGYFYTRADIVIVPSHYEGLGLSAIEALACGRPLVVANSLGLDEIGINNFNALTFPPGNHTALANAIAKLIDDSRLRINISRNARNSISKFNLDHHISDLEDIYAQLCSKFKLDRENNVEKN